MVVVLLLLWTLVTAGVQLLLLRLLLMLSMLLSLLVLDSVLDLERMLIELRLPILERAVSRGERGESAGVAPRTAVAGAASLPSRTARGLQPFTGCCGASVRRIMSVP